MCTKMTVLLVILPIFANDEKNKVKTPRHINGLPASVPSLKEGLAALD